MELSHSINYLAVFVAAIANMVIGAVWFMPAVFGRLWMRFTGLTSESIANTPHMWASYLGSFLGSVLVAYTVARIASYAAAESVTDAAILMLLIWGWPGARTAFGRDPVGASPAGPVLPGRGPLVRGPGGDQRDSCALGLSPNSR